MAKSKRIETIGELAQDLGCDVDDWKTIQCWFSIMTALSPANITPSLKAALIFKGYRDDSHKPE